MTYPTFTLDLMPMGRRPLKGERGICHPTPFQDALPGLVIRRRLVKAIVWTKYGSPEGLELQEVEKPTPKEGEVLVKIHATTAFAGDCEFRRLKFPILLMSIFTRMYVGLVRPKRITILWQELARKIEEIGRAHV